MRRWADVELRSVIGQFEFVLRRALQFCGRINPGSKSVTPNRLR
jgi:hypothetical protein